MFKYDFLLAKLHGIHSKSILGKKYDALLKVQSLDRLHKELFPEDEIHLESKNFFTEIERKFKQKTINQINYISRHFGYKNRFINNLILRYELDNVKILLDAYFAGEKQINQLFEIDMIHTLDYEKIYKLDLTLLQNVVSLLEGTIFDFLIPHLKEECSPFLIHNLLDKFYYRFLMGSLKYLSAYERKKLKSIIIQDMNWQNITWAFRTKIYYKKSFKSVKDTFLTMKGLVPAEGLEDIFDLTFIMEETEAQLSDLPVAYKNIVLKFFKENGDFDLIGFEQYISSFIADLYTKNFFIETFNLLPIIAFIYLKQQEYQNVIHLVESLRYRK